MSKPILTYFDFAGGRGEASRLALHLAKVEWVDDRFQGDWQQKKPTTPFGGLPTLEIPGKGVLSQSNAILEYIGRPVVEANVSGRISGSAGSARGDICHSRSWERSSSRSTSN